jgi:hypothetical protein
MVLWRGPNLGQPFLLWGVTRGLSSPPRLSYLRQFEQRARWRTLQEWTLCLPLQR